MTKEYEQRATRNERERVVSQSPPAPASPTATPVYVYLHAAPRISHITACKKELRKLWRSGPRATTPQSGSGACKLATGAAAHAPLGLVVVWPLGPMDPRESRWATADEAGDLIRRAGCRSPKDEGGVFCQPHSARRAACPSCTASSAGEGCWRRRGLAALCRPHPKGPAPMERKRCLAAVGGEKAGRRLHSPGVGEGSIGRGVDEGPHAHEEPRLRRLGAGWGVMSERWERHTLTAAGGGLEDRSSVLSPVTVPPLGAMLLGAVLLPVRLGGALGQPPGGSMLGLEAGC